MLYYEEIKQQLKESLKNDFNKMQKTEIEACICSLFLTYEQLSSSKKESQLENLQKILGKEEVLIAYAYGAYISNQMARLFKDKDFSIKWRNMNQLKTLKNKERKRELRKYAFANKDMFIKQILEESKRNSKYKIGWEMDEGGMHILNINVTNYKQYPFKERRKRGFPEDIIISVHVLDPRLSKVLTKLEKYPQRGSKPEKIFKTCNFEGR